MYINAVAKISHRPSGVFEHHLSGSSKKNDTFDVRTRMSISSWQLRSLKIGFAFSHDYLEKLAQMIRVLNIIENTKHEIVQIGDNDGGRFICMDATEDKASLKINHINRVFDQISQDTDTSVQDGFYLFQDAGIFVYRGDNRHFTFSFSPKGQKGRGGHSHNDVLSFTLSIGNQDIFVDPGTYSYSGDPMERNSFRSIAQHNTLSCPGIEPCHLSNNSLFTLYEEGKIQLEEKEISKNTAIIQSLYKYCGRWHRRRLVVNRCSSPWLVIEDWCSHDGARCVFILGLEIECDFSGASWKVGPLKMHVNSFAGYVMSPEWMSPTYGIKDSTKRIDLYLRKRYLRVELI